MEKEKYINIEELMKRCYIDPIIDGDEDIIEPALVDAFKYEIYRSLIDRVLHDYDEDNNDKLIMKQSESFMLAYNTLLKYKIIKTL